MVKWWANGSFAVHQDMQSQSCVLMLLGSCAIYNTNQKQKLNTTSSAEAKLVAVSDSMPQTLWTSYFENPKALSH